MLPPTSDPDGIRRLKATRNRLRLSTREVARLSRAIAAKRNDPQYYISHTWVAELEAGKFTPKLCKIESLSIIYKCRLEEILAMLGLDIDLASKAEGQGLVNLPHTALVVPPTPSSGETIVVPLGLRDRTALENTDLVSRLFESWGEVPIAMLQQMDWRNSLYGYIGTRDYTLYPVIRPGAFVRIDARQRKIKQDGWKDEFDRPVYFTELRNGYVCSWCEVNGNQLALLPSPHSGKQAKYVRYPGDANVLGRVTAVIMPIAETREKE
jgi:transcriptional regulator with XRE-family HTH domain